MNYYVLYVCWYIICIRKLFWDVKVWQVKSHVVNCIKMRNIKASQFIIIHSYKIYQALIGKSSKIILINLLCIMRSLPKWSPDETGSEKKQNTRSMYGKLSV